MQLLSRRATWRIASVTLLLTVLVIACSAVQTYPHAEPVVATHQSFDYQRDIRPIWKPGAWPVTAATTPPASSS